MTQQQAQDILKSLGYDLLIREEQHGKKTWRYIIAKSPENTFKVCPLSTLDMLAPRLFHAKITTMQALQQGIQDAHVPTLGDEINALHEQVMHVPTVCLGTLELEESEHL